MLQRLRLHEPDELHARERRLRSSQDGFVALGQSCDASCGALGETSAAQELRRTRSACWGAGALLSSSRALRRRRRHARRRNGARLCSGLRALFAVRLEERVVLDGLQVAGGGLG